MGATAKKVRKRMDERAKKQARESFERLLRNPVSKAEAARMVAERAVRKAEEKLGESLRLFSCALGNAYGFFLLTNLFGWSRDTLLDFQEKLEQRRAVIETGYADINAIIGREIRGNAFEDRPTLGWKSYEPMAFDADSYRRKALGSPDGLDESASMAVRLWGASTAVSQLSCMEVLYLSVLLQHFGWGKPKCQLFSALFRIFWSSTEEDVRGLMEAVGIGGGWLSEKQVRGFMASKGVWKLALLKRGAY